MLILHSMLARWRAIVIIIIMVPIEMTIKNNNKMTTII